MVDGVAATDLMSVMFSDTTAAAPVEHWSAQPEPSGLQVLVEAIERFVSPAGQLDAVRRALAAPIETLRSFTELARAAAAAGPSMRPVAASSLTGPIGPHRRWS
jgi:diacylglycerol O-acyltransferase / wax synthase